MDYKKELEKLAELKAKLIQAKKDGNLDLAANISYDMFRLMAKVIKDKKSKKN